MDESKCLMLLKKNHMNLIRDNHHPSTTKPMKKHVGYFDTARRGTHIDGGDGGGGGGAGGCIWPPRSYACSFCKRLFKSAQALGGHMNVHRRDRALLKQAIFSNNNNNNNNNDKDNNMKLNNYRNNSSNNNSNNNRHDYYSHIVPKKSYVPHITSSNNVISSNFSQGNNNRNYYVRKFDQNVKEENFQTERKDDYLSYKKCKKNGGYVALLPLFLDGTIKNSNGKNDVGVPRIFGLNGSKSMDDLDLELRLGNLA
ncbi:hypothetical protein RND81_03G172000 [Saponaria officinalis]|uniref:C2H2-type domain-containing protein n=1 Tax=Saponaria officinalis TaxID=3572 RepID=A0AAW1M4P4_SAPOF